MDDLSLKNSVQYIEEHLTEKICPSMVAAYAGYSEFHFSRLFREKMACSVMEYVRKRRLYKACKAIMDGKKITDVALLYRWQSPNSFCRAFKSEYGFPPSFLRAMYLTLSVEGGWKMESITFKHVSENMTEEELFKVLKNSLSKYADYREEELTQIYRLCHQVYQGMKRHSGNEYVTHPLHTAILLTDMEAEMTAVYAGMFCDILKKDRNNPSLPVLLENGLPKEVWELIKEVNKCSDIRNLSDENARLVKLAERLHNMRTVNFMDKTEQMRRASETLEIFLPAARKTGLEELVSELNDLAIRYM